MVELPDLVRFDEEENPHALDPICIVTCPTSTYSLPATTRITASSPLFPGNPDGAVAGWMYLNLDNYHFEQSPSDTIGQQNWVIVSMRADGRYSVDFDATALGNGCSPPFQMTDWEGDLPVVGPAPNTNPGL